MRALVVIPNDSTYVAVWSLERCVQLHDMGFEVICLDLSSLDYLTPFGKVRKIINILAHKNRWRTCLKILEKEGTFRSLKVWFPRVGFKQKGLTSFEKDVFQRAAIATFAWDFGSSQLSLDQISTKATCNGRKIFEIALAKVKEELAREHFDLVSTVNGRGFADSAVMSAAKENQIPYELIEKTTENWGFFSIMKTTSQDCVEIARIIQEIWDSTKQDRREVESIGQAYLENKIIKTKSARNVKGLQILSNSGRPYVVFFPGSDYELAAFPTTGWEKTTFRNQFDAFKCLANICKELGYDLVVRVHPHRTKSNVGMTEDRIWNQLANEFEALLIGASDSIDSLELAFNAHTNVVYESSIGVEIAYLGFPVVVTAFATYAPFVPHLQAFDSDSMRSLLVSPRALKDKGALIPWGYVMATGEIPIKSFSMRSYDEIYFREKLIDQSISGLASLMKYVYKINDKLRGSASSRNLSAQHRRD